jgi:hypothetical protein
MTPEEQQFLANAVREKEQAQYDAIVNAIAAADSDAQNAQTALAQAWANGDSYAASEHQRRLTRAETRLQQLENGKDAWDGYMTQPQTQQQTQGRQMTHQDVINSMTGLMPEERQWLHRFPHLVGDANRVNELQGTYAAAQRMGLVRGTPEYFQFFEQRLGLDAGSQVGLTPQQMDAAKISGVSPEVYAENVRKMHAIDARFGPRYNR